jgi:hypothetical protein
MRPSDLVHAGTVYNHVCGWTENGTLARMHTDLRRRLRVRHGGAPDPRLAMVDTQSVNTPEVGGDAGVDAGKQVDGRPRHMLVALRQSDIGGE